jgi:hypothetical protein
LLTAPDRIKELAMIFDWDREHALEVAEVLEEASCYTGFSTSDIEELIASELDTPHLLEYITALRSNRMN